VILGRLDCHSMRTIANIGKHVATCERDRPLLYCMIALFMAGKLLRRLEGKMRLRQKLAIEKSSLVVSSTIRSSFLPEACHVRALLL
jgi:hypothetical protein